MIPSQVISCANVSNVAVSVCNVELSAASARLLSLVASRTSATPLFFRAAVARPPSAIRAPPCRRGGRVRPLSPLSQPLRTGICSAQPQAKLVVFRGAIPEIRGHPGNSTPGGSSLGRSCLVARLEVHLPGFRGFAARALGPGPKQKAVGQPGSEEARRCQVYCGNARAKIGQSGVLHSLAFTL